MKYGVPGVTNVMATALYMCLCTFILSIKQMKKRPTLFHGFMSSRVQRHFDQTNPLTSECGGLTEFKVGGLSCFALFLTDVVTGQYCRMLTTKPSICCTSTV